MRGTLVALSLSVPLVAGACVDAVTGPDRELPESRGTPVGVVGGVDSASVFAWSADGTALFFRTSAEPATLARIDVTGGSLAELVSAWSGYRDLHAAPDGRTLYFVADTGQAAIPIVFRLPLAEGAPVGLGRTTAEPATRSADGTAVLPAPRADTAALIIAPDSVVLDGPDLRAFVADGCERLIAFSPEGDRLLCVRTPGAAVQYRVLDLTTTDFESVDVVAADEDQPLDVAWPAGGILSLYFGETGFGVYDVTTVTSRVIAPRPGHAFVADATHGALSADGRFAAYWLHTCLDAEPGTCSRGQSVLHVVELATGVDRVAAVATGATAGSHIAFSPDAMQIAYIFERTLYRVPVP